MLQGKRDGRVRLIGLLLVAAIPYLAAAFLVERYAGDALRSPLVVGNALVGFGLLLYGADKLGLTVRRIEHMTFGQALTIGIFQCFAVIPGASGTGITMTIGRVLGYERPDAVRFAFLLSIPILAAVAGYKGWLVFQRRQRDRLPQAGAGVRPVGRRRLPRHRVPELLGAPRRLPAVRALPRRVRRLSALPVLRRGRAGLLTEVGYGRW